MTDEDQFDPDVAVTLTELLSGQVWLLDTDFLQSIILAFPLVAAEYDGEARDLVANTARDFGLDDDLEYLDEDRATLLKLFGIRRQSPDGDGASEGLPLPPAKGAAYIIGEFMVFLKGTHDQAVLDPDCAAEMEETLGVAISQFDKVSLRELVDAFPVTAEHFHQDVRHIVRDIPFYFRLKETLAADDPVRLAELQRIRDARG